MDSLARAAAAVLAFQGLGFGLPGIYAVWSVASGRGVATFLGFPTYGEGPFERVGVHTTVPLLLGFLVVSALEVVAALLLWNGSRWGGVLALVLLVPGCVYWWGFALPIPWILAAVRTLLLVAGWRELG